MRLHRHKWKCTRASVTKFGLRLSADYLYECQVCHKLRVQSLSELVPDAEYIDFTPRKDTEPDPIAGYWCKRCDDFDACDCAGYNECLDEITKIIEEL